MVTTTGSTPTTKIDILIIGSGPTGLTAAAESIRLGLTVRIIDRKEKRQTTQSRALVVHSRTMELLHALGSVTDKIDKCSQKMNGARFHFGKEDGELIAHNNLPWGDDVEFPFYYGLPQFNTESILQEEVERIGGKVEWGKTLEGIYESREQNNCMESTIINNSDDSKETIQSRWVIGCDGSRSFTRDQAGIEMNKQTSDLFILADFKTDCESLSDRVGNFTVFYHPHGVCGFFSIHDDKKSFRIFAQPPNGFTKDCAVDAHLINSIIYNRIGIDNINCYDLEWATSFHITHGVSNAHRKGNIFLAGDAVHVHSPVGGQGMNFGIHDAFNLVWKLAWAKRMEKEGEDDNNSAAVQQILDSYEAERRPVALSLVHATNRATYAITIQNSFFRFFRDQILQYVLKKDMAKVMLSRGLGALDLKYNDSSPIILSAPSKSFFSCTSSHYSCFPGERMPNFFTIDKAQRQRLYSSMDRVRHSWVVVHINEKISPQDIDTTGPGGLSLIHVSSETDNNFERNLKTHAVLVRPDLYVATVGDTVEDIWKEVGEVIGIRARSSM